MAPAALWAALAVGLCTVPAQVAFALYVPEPGSSCQPQDYFDTGAQACCSLCPPGHHLQSYCNKTSDTKCAPCEDSTYTELWNRAFQCLSCDSRCSSNQVETQACTREQNRICTCRPGWYCMLRRQEGCRLCTPLRKCRPGFGVAKPGTATSDVVCAPCGAGTFSDTTSPTDTCRPHQICLSVSIPGNASMDAVCTAVLPTMRMAPGSAPTSQTGAGSSQHTAPTPGPSRAPSTFFLLPVGPSPPVEGLSTGNISLPIGVIAGVTAFCLVLIGLVNCVIMMHKKEKPLCLQGEAKVPHLPADKARGAPGSEQQHLLTAAPSSSSSSLESSASAVDRRAPSRSQLQAPGPKKASGSGEARASSGSSEPSLGGHGTQVNVTCIVNVCSSSDHSTQCPSQASSTTGESDASPSGSPKDEQVPFSKEECPFQSQPGAPETLLQSPEEKPLPLGVPDAGMKHS
ncbi:tumor necrosis factor receptor superfamily member 1B [Manis javanica]|uniref:tumor necrosis factor receptor superfamily member 1B n=1 Tax=Manis javanica TaxID=9974 RepID=UPI001879AEA0|nr:tumor necrosis factor receptor superfamily member 1B [Manis javanica]